MKPLNSYTVLLVALIIVSTTTALPSEEHKLGRQEHRESEKESDGLSELEVRYLMQALGNIDSPTVYGHDSNYDRGDSDENLEVDTDDLMTNDDKRAFHALRGKKFTPLRGKRFTPLRGKRFSPLRGKRFTPLRGKRFTPLRGKRFTPLRGKRFSPLRGKRFSPLRGKKFSPLRGKKFSPLRGKRFTPLRGKEFNPLSD